MKVFKILFVVGTMITACSVYAGAEAVSSRDVSIDAALVGEGGMSGVLPPTGNAMVAPATLFQSTGGFVDPSRPNQKALRRLVTEDKIDKKAVIYDLEGKARISKKGEDGWQDVKAGVEIQEGDVIITSPKSKVFITFDRNYYNVTYVPENTRVVFKSIEPTDMFLEDGTVYNMFDGIPKGSNWQVSTPTAVAAVRGTWMVVNFLLETGEFLSIVVDVEHDGEDSKIEVIDILDSGEQGSSVIVPEGKQIFLEQGQSPDTSQIEDADPSFLNELQGVLEDLANNRDDQGDEFGDTGGEEFTEPGEGDGNGPELDFSLDSGTDITDPVEETIIKDEMEEEPEDPGEGGGNPCEDPGNPACEDI